MPEKKCSCLANIVAISAAVIFVSLSLAFSTWTRTIIIVPLSIAYATIADRTGWRHKSSAYNSTKIKNLHRERMKQLDTRALGRRLTEISSRARDLSPFHLHHHQQEDGTAEADDHGDELRQQRSPTFSLSRLSPNSGIRRFRDRRPNQDVGTV